MGGPTAPLGSPFPRDHHVEVDGAAPICYERFLDDWAPTKTATPNP